MYVLNLHRRHHDRQPTDETEENEELHGYNEIIKYYKKQRFVYDAGEKGIGDFVISLGISLNPCDIYKRLTQKQVI